MRLVISAAHKSSGKTTVSLGLAAALAARGLRVQTFKKGPDYIDPIWLAAASGRPCYNLDPYLSSWQEITSRFQQLSADADFVLIEANKGLYDGLALDGSNSNAAVAARLQAPIILVLDARGMTRGIAPLILGYQSFDPSVHIAGVILNQLGGSRHESKLRQVIEHYTDVAVIGAMHKDAGISLTERHLGLIPGNEMLDAAEKIDAIAQAVAAQVDLELLLQLAAQPIPATAETKHIDQAEPTAAPATLDAGAKTKSAPGKARQDIKIAIARDRSFGFYYSDDLAALQAAGAELIAFDTLRDKCLPPADGLIIGGGFPESFAAELAANQCLKSDIRKLLAAGLPAYAECGGLVYLARSLRTIDGQTHAMCGVIPGDAVMREHPTGRGYVHLEPSEHFPWPLASKGEPRSSAGAPVIRAHEFHYSDLVNLPQNLRYAWNVRRGHGLDGKHDGLVIANLLASYSHLRGTGECCWAERFVDYVACRRNVRNAA